jgi:hypothetical protein
VVASEVADLVVVVASVAGFAVADSVEAAWVAASA